MTMTTLDTLEKELQKACPTLELRKNEPMSRHTTCVLRPVRM